MYLSFNILKSMEINSIENEQLRSKHIDSLYARILTQTPILSKSLLLKLKITTFIL